MTVFDVLGFKSFCQHNADGKVAEDVLTTIDLVPEGMSGLLSASLGQGKNLEKARELVSKMIWLVFSDTVLAALAQPESDNTNLVVIYSIACAVFNRLMFDRGLPVRGSIQFGEFLLGNRCVAGRVVVGALDQIHDLECACTVLSNDAWVHIYDRLKDHQLSEFLLGMLPRHLVDCKSEVRTLAVLNWFNVTIGKTENPPDMTAFVMTSFLAHGKHLDASAHKKAQNTAAIFEKFAAKPKAGINNQIETELKNNTSK